MSEEQPTLAPETGEVYHETYRPQFHFTARKNWLNDPNGLVYYRGEYHLFFQHNPSGIDWGNMTWGHAISRDLIHWQQLPDALEPDALGTMFSGSAVVDTDNTAELQTEREKVLVALYTAAGGTNPESEGQPFTQCLAYSQDKGRTWTKWEGNPVLPHIVKENRDPKVTWHAPTRRWIMALFLDGNEFALFASPNLKEWTRLQTLTLSSGSECPDFFPLAVEGEPETIKWVFTAANGHYLVGDFDGEQFTAETEVLPSDRGANFYAVQTYSDIPETDGRRIQMAWMSGGKYPEMPFNQQMSFPCTLTLHRLPEGLRLFRWPIEEIRRLVDREHRWRRRPLQAEDTTLADLHGDLWDIEAEFLPGEATAFGLMVRGEAIRYEVATQTLSCLGRSAPLPLAQDRVKLRVLVDRASLEVFGNGGQVSLTSCFLPPLDNLSLRLFTEGGTATLLGIRARTLSSAWHNAPG